ncbi:NAD(P)-binding domain-containing protein [Nocardia jiangxiensis]|uniref:NAD(P)-binding domain-containing protein n=1 Tax=Nocardia jiangxiensis TaxID=282685 RepID=A0ABW6RU22_9NOCA|nr:NAD(P)-binding domain-containing protein [Nocardia jiangxiensis]
MSAGIVETATGADLRAGVIGLGTIGGGVAISLARSGRVPVVQDARTGISDRLPGVPTQVATPADVARASDVVLIAVVDAEQAESVLIGPDGILGAARDGLTVALLSTISLASFHRLAALCAERGVTLLDAAVTGGGAAADNGLVVMVGGPDDAVARARPVLEDFARVVVHCGPAGAGMVTKLARNMLTYASWAVVREAHTILAAGGVAPDRLLEVLERSTDGGTEPFMWFRKIVAGEQPPEGQPEYIDALAQKDLAAAQEFAGATGIHVPITDVVRPVMEDVFAYRLPEPLPTDTTERGRAMLDRVYGKGFGELVDAGTDRPLTDETVGHLFADIWSRPHLTVRDRRLLVLGATAMLGRTDLLEIQLRGATENGELTTDQLYELNLLLAYYTGWGNGTSLQYAIKRLAEEPSLPLVRDTPAQ